MGSIKPWGIKISTLIVVIMSLFLATMPKTTLAQDGIRVDDNGAEMNFPDTVEFRLSASSDSDIEDISLIYGTNGRSCQEGGSRNRVEFETAATVDVEWEWELKRSGAIPPGAFIWWEWDITDAAGNRLTTERQQVIVSDDRHSWRRIERDGVSVNWYLGNDAFGEETLQLALENLERLSEEIGVAPEEEILFWIYPTAADVREAIIISSEWAGAVALTQYDTMLVGLSPGQSQWAESVIPHELTHVIVAMATFNCRGGWLPVWLSEGLAVYGEGVVEQDDLAGLEQALGEDRLRPLKSLSDGFSAYGGDARQAYSHSGEVVRYLIGQFGSEKMSDLLSTLSTGLTIDDALEDVYGFDTNGLDALWRESMGYQPTPTSIPAASSDATQTPVPTISMVGPVVATTETPTPVPPTKTPEPARTVAEPSKTTTPSATTGPILEVTEVAVVTDQSPDIRDPGEEATNIDAGDQDSLSQQIVLGAIAGAVALALLVLLVRTVRR